MDDLAFGLRTTVLGMGIVFGVLAILWGLLMVVWRFDGWVSDVRGWRSGRRTAASQGTGEPAAAGASAARGAPVPIASAPVVRLVDAPDGLDPRLVAAITVAILRHEETRRLQAAPAMRSYWPGSLLFASRWVAAGRTRQGQSWLRRR